MFGLGLSLLDSVIMMLLVAHDVTLPVVVAGWFFVDLWCFTWFGWL